MRKTQTFKIVTFFLSILIGAYIAPEATGNDSAASIAAGGIQLKSEKRISMEKERLTVSREKIIVEYEFLNETDSDISTVVAFPLPMIHCNTWFLRSSPFDEFQVWIDGQELEYETNVRALFNNEDQTKLLEELNIDIGSCGNFSMEKDPEKLRVKFEGSWDFKDLSESQKNKLTGMGLIDSEEDDYAYPKWEIEKTYYWNQTFPARQIVNIRHEYKPVPGYQKFPIYMMNPDQRMEYITQGKGSDKNESYAESALQAAELLDSACIETPLQKKLSNDVSLARQMLGIEWIDYTLTTANSWKTPIKDFELIIERPEETVNPNNVFKSLVSLCWDGPIKKLDENRFQAKVKDFIPNKELKVFFIDRWLKPSE